jgi:hypothetical protein
MSKEHIDKVLNALEGAQLTRAELEEIRGLVLGTELRTFGGGMSAGGVVPGPVPGEPAPEVLMQPQTTVLPQPQAARLQEFAAKIGQISPELRSGSGWRSRKLWVALVTLAGMMAQLPMDMALPPTTELIIGGIAGLYIIVQGSLDALVKSRSVEPAA